MAAIERAMTGGCLCKAVRYVVNVEAPLGVRVCWCRDCQYFAAGSGTVNAIFPKDVITVTGEVTDYSSIADSGSVMHRKFCPRCGTPLFSESETRPHLTIIRVGTMDDPERAKPQGTIWTGSAPSWACIDPILPTTEAQPKA